MTLAAALDQSSLLTSFRLEIGHHQQILETCTDLTPHAVMSSSWDYFSQLSASAQAKKIQDIAQLNQLLLAASKTGVKLTSDRRLAWFAISRLGLLPSSDAFEQIGDSDFFEIYNAEGIQIFRNLEFYALISYSIAEITLYPWYRLYGREAAYTAQIQSEAFGKAFDGRRETFRPAIDSHESCELISEEQRRFRIWPGVISPLFDRSGRATAFLATSQRSRVDSGC